MDTYYNTYQYNNRNKLITIKIKNYNYMEHHYMTQRTTNTLIRKQYD